MNKYLLYISVFLTALSSFSQQDAQYTQYMYNTISVNPAYAGSRGVLSITGLHRSQWVGLEGAPKTQTLNVHMPVGGKVGLGFNIINDEIGNGVNQETNFDIAFSYTIPVSEKHKLSFGLKGAGHLLNVAFSRLDDTDNIHASNIDNKF